MVEIKFVIEAIVIILTLALVLAWLFPEFQAILNQFIDWFRNSITFIH